MSERTENKRMKRFTSSFVRVALMATLVISAAFAVAQPKDREAISEAEKTATLARLEAVLTRAAFVPGVDFKKWPEMVKQNEAELAKTKTVGDFTRKINQVMESYGFSHIVLFSPEAGEMRNSQSRAGIGIRIELEPEGIRVVRIFPGSPAEDIGLLPGDLIVEADGKPTLQVADLAGDAGQESEITFLRGTNKLKKKVTRRQYSTVMPETLEWKGDVAVVTIPSFDAGYSAEKVETIMTEVSKRAKAVVLDLRGNGGGRVINLQHLASFFFDKEAQPLGTFVGRTEVARYERAFGPSTDPVAIAEKTERKVTATANKSKVTLKVPVSCLIDGGSGSASEMMAGALRENLNSKLYGRKSAGAVLASMILPLGDDLGFLIQFPVTDYVTIKGYRIEGNPIIPDHEFGPVKFGEPDSALNSAITDLNAKIGETQ